MPPEPLDPKALALIFLTMTFADCPTPAIVMNAAAYSISGANQKLYSRLKTSLQLNLRRQIFLAVCDDLELRSYLVAQLQTALCSPRFVSLNLNLSDPNPMAQVAQWLSQHDHSSDTSHSPGFQILGVEHLTRQPAPVQKRFLTHLQAIEYYLPGIDGTIVLWLPRPWLRSLQQSAPAFWDWHTALFEFEGDPAPLRSLSQSRLSSDRPLESAIAPLQILPATRYTDHSSPAQSSIPAPAIPVYHPEPLPESFLEVAPVEESIWDMLTYDLAQLDAGNPQRNGAKHTITEAIVDAVSSNTLQNSQVTSSFASTSRLTQQILAAIAKEPTLAEHQIALRSLQQIDQLLVQRAAQKTIAAAYRELGRLYQNRLERGNPSPETLDIAIAVHEETLEWLQDDTRQWVDGANDLGNLYWMQSHSGVTADPQQPLSSLQKAIHIYTLALDKTPPQANPHTYAMIQNNLGSAYGDLAHHQDPANNLLKSVEAYESALRYGDPQEDTARNAATQNNLGTACWNLAQHQQPIVRLNQAIAAYHAALQYYSPNSEPMHYAMIQNNLGTAYWNLAQHLKPNPNPNLAHSTVSPTRLLQLAIAAYHTALNYRTVDTVPASFAATQNNLGTAYWNLANLKTTAQSDRGQQLQQAIKAYEAAIAAVESLSAPTEQRPALTFDICATFNNLGLSYFQLAGDRHNSLTLPQRQTLLESALNQHVRALQGWEPHSDFYQTTLDYITQTTRAFHSEFGIQGQTLALSNIPANLLPEIMRKL